MKGCTSPALFLGQLLLSQLALAQQTPSGVVQWNIQKRPVSTVPNRLLRRAGSTYDVILRNERLQGGYYTDCEMGTPGQKVTLQLDTGSSDIWVPDSATSVCENNGCQFGSCMWSAPPFRFQSLPLFFLEDGMNSNKRISRREQLLNVQVGGKESIQH